MCDSGLYFCFCELCVNRNRIKIENLFFQAAKRHIDITISEAKKGTQAYHNMLECIFRDTDLVNKMKRSVVMGNFSRLVDSDPIITHKEAFNYLMVGEYDPISRLKYDNDFRERFINRLNTLD